MEIINTILKIFTPQGFEGFIQVLVVVVMLVYILFAFMLTRLVKIMNKSFYSEVGPLFTLLTTGHLIASIFVVVVAILIL